MLKLEFYQRDPLTVAKTLLGKTLVHETAEGTVSGKIVETEAYMGPEDKASHAYGNRRTPRTETMYGPKAHAYIYLIYGLYYCFNVTAGAVAGKPEAVLVRAVEPLEGVELMKKRRGAVEGKAVNLASGPSRLCMAMGLTKQLNAIDMTAPPLYIKDAPNVPDSEVAQAPRIGVDYADDWKNMPWRLYLKGNPYVSVKAKSGL
jgi:DNA-3-methyladenine glycosylase